MLMVNGEIYNHQTLRKQLKENHQFRSQSDAEIILHLYEEHGEDCLSLLNGMFALVLWDKRQQRLLLARDRLGIKPLYYIRTAESLLFSSEMKALFAHPDCPREFNWSQALAYNMHYLTKDKNPPSFFKNIHSLPAGTLLTLDLNSGQMQQKTYWQLETLSAQAEKDDTRSQTEIIQGYGDLLVDSVELRLMAEVEIGLFLSGGIDSVSVAALAAKHQSLHTFSVLSQSTFQNGDAQAGHHAANFLNLPNHQVLFSWHDNPFTPEIWKSVLWLCETPLADAEQLYKYHLHRYAKHHRPDLKVMLLGQGSDEFNGGYGQYYADYYAEDPSKLWPEFMNVMRDFEKDALLNMSQENLEQYGNLITPNFLAKNINEIPQTHPWLYHRQMYLQSLQTYNLWHEDRTAAGSSIENRVPFLDHRLVEYTCTIPSCHWADLFSNKRILREAMRDYLPKELVERPKVPFFYGDDVRYTRRMMYELLIADNRTLLREALGDADGQHPVFERAVIEQMITDLPEDPEYTHMESLFKLVNMGLLAGMAKDDVQVHQDKVPVLEVVSCREWNNDDIALRLSIRRDKLSLDNPLAFAENVLLLHNKNHACWHLAVNGQIEYDLYKEDVPEWLMVLQHINGQDSLNHILLKLELPIAKIRKNLEEALDYKLLFLKK